MSTLEIQTSREGNGVMAMRRKLHGLDEILEGVADQIVKDATARAPIQSGNLKRSIKKYEIGPGQWWVVVGAEYGIYVEYGTRYQPAQPFFWPAVFAAYSKFGRGLK